jgi:hypothetical protein
MQTITRTTPKATIWAGYVMSGLVLLFLVFDGGIKLVPLAAVPETMQQLGWPTSAGMARGLGILLLSCTALYAWPRTSIFGAILLTGYLGGAIATQLRIAARSSATSFSASIWVCSLGAGSISETRGCGR